jgi:PII-like signaling protein
VVEIVDTEEKIEAFLPLIDGAIDEGGYGGEGRGPILKILKT